MIDGTAKNCKGGFKAVNMKSKSIYIFNDDLIYEKLNSYE